MGDRALMDRSGRPGRTGPEPGHRWKPTRARPLILVAEGDPADLRLYSKVLWYNGFDVMTAGDGEEAVARALEHRPDLVLVDLLLPGLTGIGVCERLRARGLKAPIVVLTARAEREFGHLARQAGCVGYLEKPISPLDVLHYVEDMVGRPPPPGEDDAPGRRPQTD
jgi:CheY-like chemotaxis protein